MSEACFLLLRTDFNEIARSQKGRKRSVWVTFWEAKSDPKHENYRFSVTVGAEMRHAPFRGDKHVGGPKSTLSHA